MNEIDIGENLIDNVRHICYIVKFDDNWWCYCCAWFVIDVCHVFCWKIYEPVIENDEINVIVK